MFACPRQRAPAVASSSSQGPPPESRRSPPDIVGPPSAPRVLRPSIPRNMPSPGSCHKKPARPPSPLVSFDGSHDAPSRSPSPDEQEPTSHTFEHQYAPFHVRSHG